MLSKRQLIREMINITKELVEKKKNGTVDGDFEMCLGILTGIVLTLGKDINAFRNDPIGYSIDLIEELSEELKAEDKKLEENLKNNVPQKRIMKSRNMTYRNLLN